ncbi:MAG: tetratricopeptide repeat protein, partial [Bacteroidota bacterium]
MAKQMRDREELIQQLLNKAWELRRLEDYDSSRAALTSALNLCHKSDHDHLGRIYNIKMQYETDHDHFEKALPYCKTALSFYLQTQNPNKIAHATRHLADIQSELNQLDEAELNYSKAIDIYRYNIQASNGDFANALRGYALLLEKKM